MHPILAIVGRPNVGKSRLFNRMVGKRKALVHDMPGVTRDRHYLAGEWAGREFIVVDTGGLDFDPVENLGREVSKQSLLAIEEADVVICLFDGQCDPAFADKEVVNRLRSIKKPVLFVVNKIDEKGHEMRLHAFSELGASPLFPISAEHGIGVDDLLDEVVKLFPPQEPIEEEKKDTILVAVVGRPNVGKSTMINRLAGEERVVAHEIAGTTRDAIDVDIEYEGKKYTFIDTAGVKKKWAMSEKVERFSALKSLRVIDRAHVVLQLVDAGEGLTKQDMHLVGFIRDEGKGFVLLVNKWDLKPDENWSKYSADIRLDMGEIGDCPMLNISAAKGFNCLKIFSHIQSVKKALGAKISTSALNKILEGALAEHHMPVYQGKEVKIYYATQTGINPPTFTLFSNHPAAVPYGYRRYLTKRLQEALKIKGIPVKIICRRK